ncbi:TonB-dependent receptor [Propionispora vibrioides]|uniref:Iron complex outermembrane recepter protein n=1 Tax=Propionispora vibrioides TaxID=112903 RepID=A0A1H8WTP9_9FIRM|nr:TonB-dependent receptor [Propionispora vibrioides]SEP31070.1 iron complex outermembrane recepter protein [Propionispora vibrioides]
MNFTTKRFGIMLLTCMTIATSVQAAPSEATSAEPVATESSQEAAEQTATTASDQVPEYTFDDFIVTATRVAERLKNVPANVTVITAEDLKKRNVFSLREALQNEVGLYVKPTAETKDALSIRGFSSGNILVLYNGQQINTSFDSSVAWDSFPISDVERIEIVRGAGSSLYGGHAVAGVINIITKKPNPATGEVKTDLTLSTGSNNTWQRGIRIGGSANDKLSFSTGYEKRSTDGYAGYYSTASGSASGTASASVTLPKLSNGSYIIGGRGEKSKLSENYFIDLNYILDTSKTISYSYMHNNYQYSYNNPFTYAYDSNGNPIFGGTVLTQDNTYVTLKPSAYLGYVGERDQDLHRLKYEDTENKITVGLGLSDVTKEGYSSASSSANSINWTGSGTLALYPSKNYNLDAQKTWDFSRHTIVSGFSWIKEKMTYSSYELSHWRDWSTTGALTTQSEGSTNSWAIFTQDEYAVSDRWTMYTGLRLDQYNKEGGYCIVSSTRQDYPSAEFTELSPKIAFSYAQNDRTKYYASYGHSFNPPTIYKLYRRAGTSMSSIQANPDLKPETSNTFEIGMKQQMDQKTSLGVTVFRVKTEDKIAKATKNSVTAYYNMDSGMAKGIEFELKSKMTPTWSSYLNYTFESGENTSSGQTTRNWDIPKHLLHAGVEYSKNKINWLTDVQYVSERQSPDLSTGEYTSEDAFFVVNTSLNYKVNDQSTLQFGIQNLFNRKFYASEATSGRTYSLSMNYSL